MNTLTKSLLPAAFLIVMSLVSQLAHADPYDEWKVGQPRDIKDYIESRFLCTHFAGEEPYDKKRAEDINRAFVRYRCKDRLIAKDDAWLRKKYARSPKVMEVLEKIKSEFHEP